jgi:hypothetical protein
MDESLEFIMVASITVVGGGHSDMPDTLPSGHGKTIRGLDRDERRGNTSGVPWHPSECK